MRPSSVRCLLTAVLFYVLPSFCGRAGSRKLRRTTSDTLLTFVTIGFAIQWMNGYGYLRFEDQSQLVQILPILLIGLGVDYAIHMNTRYRQEIHAGRTVDVATPRRSARWGSPSCWQPSRRPSAS